MNDREALRNLIRWTADGNPLSESDAKLLLERLG